MGMTRSKQAEEHLLRAREEPTSIFVGGIAHDLNNFITIISGTAQLIESRLSLGDPTAKLARNIIDVSDRAATLIQELLSFSRARATNPCLADLNTIVASTVKLIEHWVGENISLETALDEKGLPISADTDQIAQVLMNLAANSRDSMPYGGRIRIETSCIEAESDDHGARGGRFAVLRFDDNGAGMDADTRKHVFEPFYTTKKEVGGTGLGLALVRSIVEQHQGTISVSSTFGEGTCVELRLPLQQSVNG